MWVLADGPVSTYSLLPGPAEQIDVTRGGSDLPSRAADNLYWLGRYLERTKAAVRLLRAIIHRLLELPSADTSKDMHVLLRAATHITRTYPGFTESASFTGSESELLALIFDAERGGTIRSVLTAALRAAGNVRDRLSQDTWRAVSTLGQEFDSYSPGDAPRLDQALALLNRLLLSISAFNEQTMESMTRGLAWTFLDMGRRLERSVQTADLLRCTMLHRTANEYFLLEALLEVADSVMTYRRRYLASLQPHAVLDLLLIDNTNPRSVAYGIEALERHVESLPGDHSMPSRRTDQRLVIQLRSSLRVADAGELARFDADDRRNNLDDLLDRLYIELPALSEALSHGYLSHIITARQLTERGRA